MPHSRWEKEYFRSFKQVYQINLGVWSMLLVVLGLTLRGGRNGSRTLWPSPSRWNQPRDQEGPYSHSATEQGGIAATYEQELRTVE